MKKWKKMTSLVTACTLAFSSAAFSGLTGGQIIQEASAQEVAVEGYEIDMGDLPQEWYHYEAEDYDPYDGAEYPDEENGGTFVANPGADGDEQMKIPLSGLAQQTYRMVLRYKTGDAGDLYLTYQVNNDTKCILTNEMFGNRDWKPELLDCGLVTVKDGDTLTIRKGTGWVWMDYVELIPVDDSPIIYEAEDYHSDGTEIFERSEDGVTYVKNPEDTTVPFVTVPFENLPAGKYMIALTYISDAGEDIDAGVDVNGTRTEASLVKTTWDGRQTALLPAQSLKTGDVLKLYQNSGWFWLDSVTLLPVEREDYLLGDMNGDQSVTAVDAWLALRLWSEKQEFTEEELKVADVDRSGAIAVDDALAILKVASGEQAGF